MYKDKKVDVPVWRRNISTNGKILATVAIVMIGAYVIVSHHKKPHVEDAEMDDESIHSHGIVDDSEVDSEITSADFIRRQTICNPRQLLCERRRDTLFDGLHRTDAQDLIHRVMSKAEFSCTNVKQFGSSVDADGGPSVCLDKAFVPRKNDCLIYSFGMHGDFSFEDALNDEFGCEVHVFDPSTGKGDFEHRPNVFFHDAGVWGDNFDNDIGWKFRRLGTIIQMLGHQNRVIDVMKVDADGAEWPLFRDMALDASPMEEVKQLVLKAHSPRKRPKSQLMKMTDYSQVFRAVSMLKRLGYRNFHHRDVDASGSCCTSWADLVPADIYKGEQPICCYELFMVNLNFL